MKYTIDELYSKELKCHCENCFGLCCTALFFSACDGFPQNKDAGKPCINLKQYFTCSIYKCQPMNVSFRSFKNVVFLVFVLFKMIF